MTETVRDRTREPGVTSMRPYRRIGSATEVRGVESTARRWGCAGLVFAVLLVLAGGRSLGAAEELPELQITGGGRPYVVALQRFAPDSRSESVSESFYTELRDALNFAAGFDVMDPKAFLEPTQTVNYDQPTIACDNWRASGANILVQGELERPIGSQRQRVRFRAWDIDLCRPRGDSTVLEAPGDDTWLLARRLADDVVQRFSGRRGVAATQLAFVSDESGNKEVYVMESVDGSRKRRVTNNGRINLFPAWSLDATELLYTSYRGGPPDIWWLGRGPKKGGKMLRLPKDYASADRYRAVFGPGEDKVTFVMHRNENTDIYMSDFSGRNLRRLTSHKAIDVSPSWSPDGKRMVFMSDRTGTPQLYILDLESGQERRLTYRGAYNASPAWSPTGEWIVYAARTGLENLDLYLIDPDTAYTYPLVLHPRVDQDPAWSPDGRKIAFVSDRRGNRDIYVVDMDGKNLTRITQGGGECTAPTWASWLD